MSNFRPERLFPMLDSPIPGLNHLRAINPTELSSACLITDTDADILNLPRLTSFATPRGDHPGQPRQKPTWHLPSTALPTLITTLRHLESLLDQADTHDRRFYLAMKDLP
jgi:hypothetical protein